MSEPAQTDGNPFSKGYKYRDGQPVSDACGDDRHAECMQDLTKCHCHVRSGHTTMHAYMNPGGRAQTAGNATPNVYEAIRPVLDRMRAKTADVADYFTYLRFAMQEAMKVLPPDAPDGKIDGFHAGCCALRAYSTLLELEDLISKGAK